MRSTTITIAMLFSISMSIAAESSTNKMPSVATAPVDSALTRTNLASKTETAEQIRNACIAGRRTICGRVIKILPEGLVVDSGYTALLQAPFNQSWLVNSGAMVQRDAKALELNEPGSSCIGPVFLIDYPKRPKVQLYDFVVLQGYPVGHHTYTSVPGVQKTLRQFSAGLETAIRLNFEHVEK